MHHHSLLINLPSVGHESTLHCMHCDCLRGDWKAVILSGCVFASIHPLSVHASDFNLGWQRSIDTWPLSPVQCDHLYEGLAWSSKDDVGGGIATTGMFAWTVFEAM